MLLFYDAIKSFGRALALAHDSPALLGQFLIDITDMHRDDLAAAAAVDQRIRSNPAIFALPFDQIENLGLAVGQHGPQA